MIVYHGLFEVVKNSVLRKSRIDASDSLIQLSNDICPGQLSKVI